MLCCKGIWHAIINQSTCAAELLQMHSSKTPALAGNLMHQSAWASARGRPYAAFLSSSMFDADTCADCAFDNVSHGCCEGGRLLKLVNTTACLSVCATTRCIKGANGSAAPLMFWAPKPWLTISLCCFLTLTIVHKLLLTDFLSFSAPDW